MCHRQSGTQKFDRAIQLDPEDAEGYYERGMTCVELGVTKKQSQTWNWASTWTLTTHMLNPAGNSLPLATGDGAI